MYMSRIFQNLSTMAIFVAVADILEWITGGDILKWITGGDILKWITGGDIFHFTPIFFHVKHILYKIVTCTYKNI